MMKKIILKKIILSLAIAATLNVNVSNVSASLKETNATIKSIKFDENTNKFYFSLIDSKKENWIIESNLKNKKAINRLRKKFINRKVNIVFENYDNDLYDDEIIKYRIVK